jgi:MFS family permease
MTTETAPTPPRLWRNRDFQLLVNGQVVSFVGDQVQDLALPLLVLAVSGSTTTAGILLGLHTAAYLLSGLVAGALADRWDRRITMIWCEVGRGALTASVVLAMVLDAVTIPHLMVVSVLTGMLTTLFQSANTAALPNVVHASQVASALGAQQSAFNTIRVFGASLAGVLYALGRVVPFAVNMVSFLVSALTLRFMRASFQEERTEPPAKMTHEIREGLSWLWRQPVIRFLMLVQAADYLRYGAGYLLIITLAQSVGASPLEIGVVFSGAAIGALLGALVSGKVTRRFRLGSIAVVMLWVEALVFPLYAVAPNPLLLAAVALGESVIAPMYVVAMSTYRLSITPDALRGRVSSAVSTVVVGALSIGTMLGGSLIASMGPRNLALVSGAWLLVLAAVTTMNRAVRTAPVATADSV